MPLCGYTLSPEKFCVLSQLQLGLTYGCEGMDVAGVKGFSQDMVRIVSIIEQYCLYVQAKPNFNTNPHPDGCLSK
jgi:hypothetical protein